MDGNVKPLRWHKFLIYFGLWAGAFALLVGAAVFMGGWQYGQMKANIYGMFPALRMIDLAYGLILAALAVFQIYTRFQLAGFKTGAPQKLLFLYALLFVAGIAYIIASAWATDIISTNPDAAERLIGRQLGREFIASVPAFVINKIYYGKRKELFIN